ncbi:MAG: hypothetical protein LBM04_01270 [Opitutaceae bacterium]|jgi:hypothetical protein|nr:hypothetical protein [Opitutaceae bacterium]
MKIKTPFIIALSLMAAAMLHAGDASGGKTQAGAPDGADGFVVFKLAGDGQKAPAGQWTPASLEAGVWNEDELLPLINVPVDFSLVEGGGLLAGTPGAIVAAGASARILTDADGVAQIWYRQPAQADVRSSIAASALGRTVMFTTYSIPDGNETGRPSSSSFSSPSLPPSPSGTDRLAADTPRPSVSQTAAARPQKPHHKEMLSALAAGRRQSAEGAPGSPSAANTRSGKTHGKPATAAASATEPEGSDLPDEYFAYPADHPLGRMQRGMVLFAASGKARELRDSEQARRLAFEARGWLLKALEGEMSAASAGRCCYYLGLIAERYGDQDAALDYYRKAREKDGARDHAKSAVKRIEHLKK